MPGKRIFVVDDDRKICGFIESYLKQLGPFEVFTCSESMQAVTQIRTLQPDLIILDEQMPEMSGSDIAEKLQSIPSMRNIPIVFLTGMITEQEARAKGNQIGGHYFFSKPVRLDELAVLIKKLLRVN
jgi:DNA-binding response OmpR family regulator